MKLILLLPRRYPAMAAILHILIEHLLKKSV